MKQKPANLLCVLCEPEPQFGSAPAQISRFILQTNQPCFVPLCHPFFQSLLHEPIISKMHLRFRFRINNACGEWRRWLFTLMEFCAPPRLHLLAALEYPPLQLINRLAGIKSDGENMPQRCGASASRSEKLRGWSQEGMARRVIAFVEEVKCFSPSFFCARLKFCQRDKPLWIMYNEEAYIVGRMKAVNTWVSVQCNNFIRWETAYRPLFAVVWGKICSIILIITF